MSQTAKVLLQYDIIRYVCVCLLQVGRMMWGLVYMHGTKHMMGYQGTFLPAAAHQ